VLLQFPTMRRFSAALLVPLVLVAVMAARETHAHSRADHAGTVVVHTHIAEAALHLEADHQGLQLEPAKDHTLASYLDCLQLTKTGKHVARALAVPSASAVLPGRESVVALFHSENAWAHAPPSLTSRSPRSPPSILLS
jgi:hypothetical protein